jgi:hypothetical protein
MKRLLKVITIILVTMTLVMPVLEYFDRWDRPGLSNDSELPLFLIVLFISLVLVVAAALARHMMNRQSAQTETEIKYELVRFEFRSWADLPVSAFISISPPLRI